MERREVEQKSDREVEVGVLIGKKQVPLSPHPPDTRAREDRRPLAAHTNTHARTPTHPKGTKHWQSANTQSPVNRQNIHKHSHAHTHTHTHTHTQRRIHPNTFSVSTKPCAARRHTHTHAYRWATGAIYTQTAVTASPPAAMAMNTISMQ